MSDSLFSEKETAEYLSIKQTAALLAVSSQTIRRAIYSGKLKAHDVSNGDHKAHWRIHKQDLAQYVRSASGLVSGSDGYTSKFLGI